MFSKNKIGLIIGLVVIAFAIGYVMQPAPIQVKGNLTATPGVQNGNGPVTTLDNVDAYNLDVTNALAVDGATSLAGTLGVTGNLTANGSANTIKALTKIGDYTTISTTSATYTLSAATSCASNVIDFTPLGAITTVTLPASSTTMFATCLPSIGAEKDFTFMAVGTSTVLAAGAGGTLLNTSSTTIAAGKHGLVRLNRTGTNTYDALLINFPN